MKFIDLTTKYKVDKERLKIGISVAVILLISAISVVAIKTLIDTQEAKVKAADNAELLAILDETVVSIVDDNETEATLENVTDIAIASIDETTPVDSGEPTQDPDVTDVMGYSIGETDETTEAVETTTGSTETTVTAATTVAETTAPAPTATPAPTSTPTPTPTPAYTETSLSKQVYASCELNVRSGPGTSYETVKTIDKGSAIDVIGVTDTGWYHTYNGNWVIKDLCQDTPPVKPATPTPVPQQTTQATSAPASTTAAQTQAPSSNGMTLYGSCTITFYGPQPTANGGYSNTTATGTTCTEGVTCAADWGVFPAGTVIYIENDPLGGDGYYTVEDKGSGVKGSHIDIFANEGESSAYSTTSRNVYIVN